MKLREWLEKNDEAIFTDEKGMGTGLFWKNNNGLRELHQLEDYAVSTVSGPVVWLRPVQRIKTVRFKVLVLSNNVNSFGMRGVVLKSLGDNDPVYWQVLSNSLNLPRVYDVLSVPVINGVPDFSRYGFECCQEI